MMKAVDAHTHLLRHPVGLDELAESGEFAEIWLMDLSGIGRLGTLEFATQAEILEQLRRYPGLFRAFGFLDLDNHTPDDICRLRDLGFCGLKPYKQLRPYGDLSYFPLYECAAKLRMPILFHTGLIARSEPYNGTISHAFGSENMRPGHLATVADAFPDLQIIAGHLGWPYWEETEQNLYYYRNISGDISGYRRNIDRMPELLDRKANDGTDRFFNHKLHYASDEFLGRADGNRQCLRLKNFWELYFEMIGSVYYRWGAPQEQQKFFCDNALNIFSSPL